MSGPPKITLNELKKHMQLFLDFPHVEELIETQLQETVQEILLTKAQNGGRNPVDVLHDYINAGENWEMRLGIVVGFTQGSIEKLKRVFAALCPGRSWNEVKTNTCLQHRMVQWIVNPFEVDVYIPPFLQASFSLPGNWVDLLQNKDYLQGVVRSKLQAKYAVWIGNELESQIKNVIENLGYGTQKGKVEIVDNKEVDVVVPDTDNPRILIMASYQLTTSSSQSSKANEQMRMYRKVQEYRDSRGQRRSPDIKFINVIDGGGWLARLNDLETIWKGCDYCFALANLGDLKDVLDYVMNP